MYNKPNEKLLNGCTQILEEYSNNIHHKISLVENESYFGLVCKNPSNIKHDNNDYNVATFKLLNNLGFNFALKFNIYIKSTKKLIYTLTDANLRIFHLNDNKSQLLFRAEFATNEMNKSHAQPHWQFEPYITKAVNVNDYNAILELRDYEYEITDFVEDSPIALNISKIHFAMTSDWHKAKKDQILKAHCVIIDEDNVVDWLDGCMNYIENQLKML